MEEEAVLDQELGQMEPRMNLEARGTSNDTHKKSHLHTSPANACIFMAHVCVSFIHMHACLYSRLSMRLLNCGYVSVVGRWCILPLMLALDDAVPLLTV